MLKYIGLFGGFFMWAIGFLRNTERDSGVRWLFAHYILIWIELWLKITWIGEY
jgi:hypothetical protein